MSSQLLASPPLMRLASDVNLVPERQYQRKAVTFSTLCIADFVLSIQTLCSIGLLGYFSLTYEGMETDHEFAYFSSAIVASAVIVGELWFQHAMSQTHLTDFRWYCCLFIIIALLTPAVFDEFVVNVQSKTGAIAMGASRQLVFVSLVVFYVGRSENNYRYRPWLGNFAALFYSIAVVAKSQDLMRRDEREYQGRSAGNSLLTATALPVALLCLSLILLVVYAYKLSRSAVTKDYRGPAPRAGLMGGSVAGGGGGGSAKGISSNCSTPTAVGGSNSPHSSSGNVRGGPGGEGHTDSDSNACKSSMKSLSIVKDRFLGPFLALSGYVQVHVVCILLFVLQATVSAIIFETTDSFARAQMFGDYLQVAFALIIALVPTR